MKRNRLYYSLAAIVGLVVVFCIVDITTSPTVSDAGIATARAYAQSAGLPIPPNEFTHDGCTLFPDWLPFHDFRDACFAHDLAYWLGGDTTLKVAADSAFRQSLSDTGPLGNYLFAPMMYYAVHWFGDSWITKATNANWGYGWNE